MDRSEITLFCLLDCSKCFDVIPHDPLLRKLELYGVDTRWFQSYLAGHYQQVQVQELSGRCVTSDALLSPIGTYQGSALGPLLFFLFTPTTYPCTRRTLSSCSTQMTSRWRYVGLGRHRLPGAAQPGITVSMVWQKRHQNQRTKDSVYHSWLATKHSTSPSCQHQIHGCRCCRFPHCR